MNSVCKIGVVAALAALAGCTSYTPGSTRDERIVERYNQNIILESDTTAQVFAKGLKHFVVDIGSVFFAEFWYARVENSYAILMRNLESERKAEEAWKEFRKTCVGKTKNEIILEFGTPDMIESDAAGGSVFVYEDSMRENAVFVSLMQSMYGNLSADTYMLGETAYTSGSSALNGYSSGTISSYAYSRIQRIWFAFDKNDKVYGVNRRSAMRSR